MKRIRKDNQYFDIDYQANAAYYDSKKSPTEPYAKNFVNQMRHFNPELNEFLDMFASDITKPDDLKWEDVEDGVKYTAKYSVNGTIVDADSFEFKVRKMVVTARPVGEGKLEITYDNIVLPWILLEGRDGKLPEIEPTGIKGKLKGLFKK